MRGPGGKEKSIKWVEGIRGIASFLVIMTHLARAWDLDLFLAQSGEHAQPRVLQWPILRIPWQGRIGVTIFAFLTGFVCAIKPLKLARARNREGALVSIAKSAFRRPPRLMIPATFAMVIAWTCAQLGFYTVAHRCDSAWVREASPDRIAPLSLAIERLWQNFRAVWTNGHMEYDDHQWAMLPLLKGAFTVYMVLAVAIFMKFRYRMILYAILFCYYWQDASLKAETFGQQFMFGIFISDLSQNITVQTIIGAHRGKLTIVAFVLIGLGLYGASYAAGGNEWIAWGKILIKVGSVIFPKKSVMPDRWTAAGVDLVVLGVFLSADIRDFLSNRYLLWLGKNSFAVYLTHGTLLRIVLVWMLYGMSGQPWNPSRNEDGKVVLPPWLPRGSRSHFSVCVFIWLFIVYGCAYLWTTYVDSICVKITQYLEKKFFESNEEKPILG